MARGRKAGGHKTGGRQKGTPNKVTVEARQLCQDLVNDAAYRRKFERRWRSGKLPSRLEEMVWAYAFGKPTQGVEVGATRSLEEILRASYESRPQ